LLIAHASGLLRRAEHAMQQGDATSAMQLADAACRLAPNWPEACSRLGVMLVNAGKWREAIDVYRQAVADAPTDLSVANNLAWLLAVVPQEAARNGKDALAISERLCQMTHRQQPVFLRTLAAAHAELGHFEEAVQHAEEALGIAASTQNGSLLEQIRAQIACYRASRSFHLTAIR
jgi:Flp pilus assembly protein TadD